MLALRTIAADPRGDREIWIYRDGLDGDVILRYGDIRAAIRVWEATL